MRRLFLAKKQKIYLLIFITICLLGFISGCKLFDSSVVKIGNWDVSACDSDWDVCLELFADNPGKL